MNDSDSSNRPAIFKPRRIVPQTRRVLTGQCRAFVEITLCIDEIVLPVQQTDADARLQLRDGIVNRNSGQPDPLRLRERRCFIAKAAKALHMNDVGQSRHAERRLRRQRLLGMHLRESQHILHLLATLHASIEEATRFRDRMRRRRLEVFRGDGGRSLNG